LTVTLRTRLAVLAGGLPTLGALRRATRSLRALTLLCTSRGTLPLPLIGCLLGLRATGGLLTLPLIGRLLRLRAISRLLTLPLIGRLLGFRGTGRLLTLRLVRTGRFLGGLLPFRLVGVS
jgi:hypothetical protein